MKHYYQLTKPGIIRGNAVHVLAGALLASAWLLEWRTIIAVLAGTSFVIASACVVNNFIDRDIDSRMERTKSRPSVTGEISARNGSLFAIILLAAGLATLLVFTNIIVAIIGVIAYVLYVVDYGIAKRKTHHSTLIGAIPGALPAMAGYVAVTGNITVGAWLIFLLIFVWQMPHFYAISVFRRKEYAAAKIPVLAVKKSFRFVEQSILAYIALYLAVVGVMITTRVVEAPAGIVLIFGAMLWFCAALFYKASPVRWARTVFGVSLILTLLLLFASALNVFVVSA